MRFIGFEAMDDRRAFGGLDDPVSGRAVDLDENLACSHPRAQVAWPVHISISVAVAAAAGIGSERIRGCRAEPGSAGRRGPRSVKHPRYDLCDGTGSRFSDAAILRR